MSDDSQRWKAKYLESLEQQERQEKRWENRLDLLRRGLVRTSLAAEGSDKMVDQCMQELREIIRGDNLDAGLAGLIPRLEKAVLDSEHRRQQRSQANFSALATLARQLLDLQPPRDIRKALKRFAKEVERQAGNIAELPALLGELGSLQQQTFSLLRDVEQQRPGFLQRLFGPRENAGGAAEPLATAEPTSLPVASRAEQTAPLQQPDEQRPQAALSANTLDSLPLAASLLSGEGDDYALPASEPGYSAVAPHIAASLGKLLDELQLPSHHQALAADLRQRLGGTLNWYELVPALDDLAVLVLAVSDSGQREFAVYLSQLNERLASFLDTLNQAQEGYSESLLQTRSFNQELREQVSGLQNSVQQASDLDSLKCALETRLDGLLQTVSQHQRKRDEQEARVAERLQGLMGKVAEMEEQAAHFREHIEEQRQKALTDPLTGLPNRAGWNERLELEVARRQRYGGELLLAVLDVDHFKRINDGYGHLAGDKVLKIIAQELRKRTRKTDFLARFGGEEFVLLMPGTPLSGGQQLLETLRAAVAACPFHFKGEPLTITCSAGLTAFADNERSDQVFERADQALYQAKREGRDRLIVA